MVIVNSFGRGPRRPRDFVFNKLLANICKLTQLSAQSFIVSSWEIVACLLFGSESASSFVAPITKKITENCLRWQGYLMRRSKDQVIQITLNLPEEEERKRDKGFDMMVEY